MESPFVKRRTSFEKLSVGGEGGDGMVRGGGGGN